MKRELWVSEFFCQFSSYACTATLFIQQSDALARCNHTGCVEIANPHLGDWFCGKCEKTKKPHASVKVKRPISSGAEKEDSRVRWECNEILEKSISKSVLACNDWTWRCLSSSLYWAIECIFLIKAYVYFTNIPEKSGSRTISFSVTCGIGFWTNLCFWCNNMENLSCENRKLLPSIWLQLCHRSPLLLRCDICFALYNSRGMLCAQWRVSLWTSSGARGIDIAWNRFSSVLVIFAGRKMLQCRPDWVEMHICTKHFSCLVDWRTAQS